MSSALLDLALLAYSHSPSMLGYTGVLLYDWVGALISCLVIRCVHPVPAGDDCL